MACSYHTDACATHPCQCRCNFFKIMFLLPKKFSSDFESYSTEHPAAKHHEPNSSHHPSLPPHFTTATSFCTDAQLLPRCFSLNALTVPVHFDALMLALARGATWCTLSFLAHIRSVFFLRKLKVENKCL